LKEKKMTSLEIAEETRNTVRRERESTSEVIKRLRIIDERKIYAELGYPRLWDFATKFLGYDEGQTYRRISAMRLIKENPQVEANISSGKMSLSAAAMVQTFIKKNDIPKEVVLKKVEGKSAREVERTLLKLTPHQVRPEKVRAVTEDQTEIRIVVDDKLRGLLDKLKSLRSHKNPSMTYTQLIEDMAKLAERHWDPTQKRSGAKSTLTKGRAVPSAIRTQVWKRDQSRCTFIDPVTGQKCNSTHLLEIDHIHPWALGGNHDPKNLRLLCRTHNQLRLGNWVKL
jgi:hypothetical protein